MKIQQIYDKYKIMPQLQLHMLRVAGVAKIICNNFQNDIDEESIITAALLHDMGNIIKFKLDLFPKGLKPQGLKYWKNVQRDYIKKYADEHKATYEIIRKIGVDKKVEVLVINLGYSKGKQIYLEKDIEAKIAPYADQRVAPYGVESLKRRIEQGKERNMQRLGDKFDHKFFIQMKSYWEKIEKQIFNHTKISPKDITDRGVTRLIPELREFNIRTN